MKKLILFLTILSVLWAAPALAQNGTGGNIFVNKQPGSKIFAYNDFTECTNVWYVDSTLSSAADNTGRGQSPNRALATLDYAIGRTTANNGDCIYLRPGHVETIPGGTLIDVDVEGITIIAQGEGDDRATFTYSHANSSIDIGADNVTLVGLRLNPSITDTLIAIDVESGVTNVTLDGIEFTQGDAAADEFVVAVDLKSGNDDTVIKNCNFKTKIASAGSTTGIILTAASADVRILNNTAYGNYSTAFIDDGAAVTGIIIQGNSMKVKDGEPCIEMTATTTGLLIDNQCESTGATADNTIVAADMSWFNNTAVVTDGAAAGLIGTDPDVTATTSTITTAITATNTVIGTDFCIGPYTIDGATITSVFKNVTQASSGTLLITDVIVQVGDTAMTGAASVLEIQTDNALGGIGPFYGATEAALIAEQVYSQNECVVAGADCGLPVLESGKIIQVGASNANFTSTGNAYIYVCFKRLTAGATALIAADL